ncbi:helix-turn-helix domain-containing protein [Megamonas hypermegale]|uniref:helix-turn-helix domain-containing protein n=1 Tax=Megamonas hypermegale TaxID=158847 RepID=UPI003207AA78
MLKLNKKIFDNAMAKNLFKSTDLAKKAGLSDATICDIIKNHAFRSHVTLGKVAQALNIEPIELLKDDED